MTIPADFIAQNRISVSEMTTLEDALVRMRRGIGGTSDGRRISFGELAKFHRREADRYEKLGVKYAADMHDTTHNMILAMFIEDQDRKFFRAGRGR